MTERTRPAHIGPSLWWWRNFAGWAVEFGSTIQHYVTTDESLNTRTACGRYFPRGHANKNPGPEPKCEPCLDALP